MDQRPKASILSKIVSPPQTLPKIQSHPEPQYVALFICKSFNRNIGLEWALNPRTGVLIRPCENADTDTQEDDHVKREAETGVMLPQAKKC